MRFMTMFRAVSLVSALGMALGVMGASAVVPIPIKTDAHDGGVYVQPNRVAGAVRGDWVTVSCHVHVFTEAAGVGEVMTAEDQDGNSYQAEVGRRFQPGTRDVVAGRAVFTVAPGTTLTTTNTSPVVVGACPAS